jgi:hypothetical protein
MEEFAMVNMPLIVRRLSASLLGLAMTWFVIHIPGEYAYASVWLMPSVAAFFAVATWFAFMYRGMAQGMASALNPGDVKRRSYHLDMDQVFEFGGSVCIGAGVLSAMIQAASSPAHCSWELSFAMGIGILVGVKALRRMSM